MKHNNTRKYNILIYILYKIKIVQPPKIHGHTKNVPKGKRFITLNNSCIILIGENTFK